MLFCHLVVVPNIFHPFPAKVYNNAPELAVLLPTCCNPERENSFRDLLIQPSSYYKGLNNFDHLFHSISVLALLLKEKQSDLYDFQTCLEIWKGYLAIRL
jgi:hypothetical protein